MSEKIIQMDEWRRMQLDEFIAMSSDMTDDMVDDLIDSFGPDSTVLVGICTGGQVAKSSETLFSNVSAYVPNDVADAAFLIADFIVQMQCAFEWDEKQTRAFLRAIRRMVMSMPDVEDEETND